MMITEEVWKPVVGYEGYYEVSNMGKVRSLDRDIYCKAGGHYIKKGRILKQGNSRGYKIVKLIGKSQFTYKFVHKAVAEAFIPNPDNYPEVNHKDETRDNNRVGNLEWCTKKYNMNYGTRNERAGKAISKALKGKYVGEKSPVFGIHHSEESRRKNSEAHKGKPSTFKGKHHTEKTKQILREKQLVFQNSKRKEQEVDYGENKG